MGKETEQVKRIRTMERRFDRATRALEGLEKALERAGEALPDIKAVTAYYDSDLWKRDYFDDEAGKLPEGLKRGVLSEDGVYDMIADLAHLKEELRRLSRKL